MNWLLVLYTLLLFVLLTPAIIVRLPQNGNKWTVAFVHGFIFTFIFYLTHNFILKISNTLEGLCTDEDPTDPDCSNSITTSGTSS